MRSSILFSNHGGMGEEIDGDDCRQRVEPDVAVPAAVTAGDDLDELAEY